MRWFGRIRQQREKASSAENEKEKDETLNRLERATSRLELLQERAKIQQIRRERRQPRQQH